MKRLWGTLPLFIGGCFGPQKASLPLVNASELKLDRLSGAKNELQIASEVIPVVTESRVEGDRRILRFMSHGAELEREEYLLSEESLLLARTSSDLFEPPLPVLKFPLRLGEEWSWKGSIRSGDLLVPAEAKVLAIREPIDLPPSDALKINIVLTIRDKDSSRRELLFWFVEGEGLVKRQFGASIRRLVR